MDLLELGKKFWTYLKKDTWDSWLVSLILLFIIIKFVFFPLMSLATGTQLPLVVVESCSMYHSSNLEDWWQQNAALYEARNITKEDFQSFGLRNGLNKGDILFVWGYSKSYNIGDVIIFKPNPESTAPNPIIHRIVSQSPIGTKGDNGKTNAVQLSRDNNLYNIDETNIAQSQIIGKAQFKVIPYLGWIKLIFFEPFKPAGQRGFCS